MSDRPTPETDAIAIPMNADASDWIAAAHARRLERQRDAAVEALKEMLECIDCEGFVTNAYVISARAVLREIEGKS